ncbi:nuclear transport factor 2 family protein [Massilia yuzhufengensis]|uniref:nuclear transport factor 2 family protein n=1 Tax=Massilia yuzhufengensis TaxID=1164594 RepID=UPI0015A63FBF|nr:nuclear transport factor 2 family protein [Massilia yuzhufengensis]
MLLVPALLCPPGAGASRADVFALDASDVQAQSILAAEKQRREAVAGGNVEALKRIVSREYYHVESNGRMRTRTAFLQAVSNKAFASVDYQPSDTEVQMAPGGATAVVVGTFSAVQQAGVPRRIRARFVRVWVRQGGAWVNTIHQSTEIAPAQVVAGGDWRAR